MISFFITGNSLKREREVKGKKKNMYGTITSYILLLCILDMTIYVTFLSNLRRFDRVNQNVTMYKKVKVIIMKAKKRINIETIFKMSATVKFLSGPYIHENLNGEVGILWYRSIFISLQNQKSEKNFAHLI